MYAAVTRDIQITVIPEFLSDRSEPEEGRFFWAYTIEIANLGRETVQLVGRHWVITDGVGKVDTVSGLGVVGQQPVLNPGDTFRYTSGCPLTTPVGRDGRPLPHERPGRPQLRGRDPGLLARQPAYETRAELEQSERSASADAI